MNEQLLKENTEAIKALTDMIGKFIESQNSPVKINKDDDVPMLRSYENGGGFLDVYYGTTTDGDTIGLLDKQGNLELCKTPEQKKAHAEWIKNGALVDTECVSEFNGGRYRIAATGLLYRVGILAGAIVNIDTLETQPSCEDENVKRDSQGRAIINGGER